MKKVRVEDAVGLTLCHDITAMYDGFKGALFKRGHVIREEDIPRFLDIGKQTVFVWEPDAGEIHEEDAALLERGLQDCDAVISTGGVSVGDYDLTPAALDRIGADTFARGVHLKPGMACAYAQRDGKLLCALSGNPASCITNFYTVALPALRALAGRRDPMPITLRVTLADPFRKSSPEPRVLRGSLDLRDGTARMRLPRDQGNVSLSTTIGWNVVAVIPAGSGPLEAGTVLEGFII